jgi:predicted DNA-binding WGR domain protein
MIERDLFGTVRLVCCWGRVRARGQEIATEFPTEEDAAEALEALASARRQEGYLDL